MKLQTFKEIYGDTLPLEKICRGKPLNTSNPIRAVSGYPGAKVTMKHRILYVLAERFTHPMLSKHYNHNCV